MKKLSGEDKKRLKELNGQIKELEKELVVANKLEGKDAYVAVEIKSNQAIFQKIKKRGEEDKALGNFYIEIEITAKQQEVYFPLSVASGIKPAGFMYQIEGTAEGKIVTTEIKVRGKGVEQVTLGTLLYAKIPTGKTGLFRIQATIQGKLNKKYQIVFTRLNYKLKLTDVRYQQYLKEIRSDSVLFS
jgi:hypothetical protein